MLLPELMCWLHTTLITTRSELAWLAHCFISVLHNCACTVDDLYLHIFAHAQVHILPDHVTLSIS